MSYPHADGHASANLPALDARSVARALGGDVVGRDQVAAPGPGHSRHDRSLTIYISATAPDGFRTHSHAGDNWRACRDYVKERLGIDRDSWRDRAQEVRAEPVEIIFDRDPAKIDSVLRVWSQGVDPAGTPVETYLRSRRLELDDAVCEEVLRWHPGIRAMLALFRNIQTSEPQAISRTFLDREARKDVTRAPGGRRFLGPTKGAAIKLDADEDVLSGLHIGEGIETSMAARMLGLKPTWALGSADAIRAFPVLSGIECLSLLRERDDANARAADACADRWLEVGREVFDVNPIAGNDINDSIKGAA
jgi:putative DNA primase/helicase